MIHLLKKQKASKLGKEEKPLHKRAYKMNCQEYLMLEGNYEAVKRRLKIRARRESCTSTSDSYDFFFFTRFWAVKITHNNSSAEFQVKSFYVIFSSKRDDFPQGTHVSVERFDISQVNIFVMLVFQEFCDSHFILFACFLINMMIEALCSVPHYEIT